MKVPRRMWNNQSGRDRRRSLKGGDTDLVAGALEIRIDYKGTEGRRREVPDLDPHLDEMPDIVAATLAQPRTRPQPFPGCR